MSSKPNQPRSTRSLPQCRQLLVAVGLVSSMTLSAWSMQTQDTRQAKTNQAASEPMVTFGMFSEPIELTTLIDYVGSSLNINIVVKGSPTGEIVFNAPKRIAKSKLIDFLDAMLELYSFTIAFDPESGFYIVQPISDVKPVFGSQLASTVIIPTPNIKPSLLTAALNATLGSGGAGGSARSSAIQAVDELGVLIINAPPRDLRRVERMVEELIRLDAHQQYIRFELNHLAAPIALDRVVALVGGSGSGSGMPTRPATTGQPPTGGIPSTGSSLSNLSERLTIDPQGNALIFKGTDDEIARVRKVLAVIDVPNTLEPRNYFAGTSAIQIANIAKRRGLGEVIEIETTTTTNTNPFRGTGGQNLSLQTNNANTGQGGPVMVVNPSQGSIIYYGTDEQQAQLTALLTELKTEDERVVIKEYVLNHTDALTIADLLNGIITGETQTGDSALLPGSTGRSNSRSFTPNIIITSDGESGGDFDPNKITVIPDELSNQIIIKAPIKQQEKLESLIARLDKHRPQVYIQAMIVSIADNEDFTLAFETQINAGQYSAGTNFGLSSPGTNFQDPRTVSSSLGGLTQAVIMSEFVPVIINATQTNTDVRILSTPQLLVNNNEESTIMSTEEQPYSEVTQGNNGGDALEGLGGYVEVGTTLTVTPSISDSGFVRLQYAVELSNFVGVGSGGLPPGTNRRSIDGSVTVPSDATIVIGGITVEDVRDTIIKVPLLGDIPLVGELFKRTNKANNKSKLYVFLTPRIMHDPNFNDLKLFSQGPQADMNVENQVPQLEPAIITSPIKHPQQSLPLSEPATNQHSLIIEPNTPSQPTPAQAPELEPAYIELSEVQIKDGQ